MVASIRWSLTTALLVSLVGAGCFGNTQKESTPETSTTSQSAEMNADSQVTKEVVAVSSTTQAAATTTQVVPSPVQDSTVPIKPKTPKPTTPVTKTVVVTITNSKYSPQIVAVNAGDTVMWINKDTSPHTAKSDGSLLWDSGTIRPGGTFKRVFSQPGSYKYSCGISPYLKGTVVVH
jgi:plastocyanin